MEFQEPNVWMFMTMTLRQWGYWVQVISGAGFAYVVLSDRKEDWDKPWRIVLKLLFLIGTFVVIYLALIVAMFYFRPITGVGSWLSYVGGVLLYAMLFCKKEPTARNVLTALAFSLIVLVNELGSVFGILLERTFEGFDHSIMIALANLLLVPAAVFIWKHPIWKYHVSEPASFLGVFCSSLSTLSVIVYDIIRVNMFGPEENSASMALMIVVMTTLYLINTVTYQMLFHLSQEQTNVIDLLATRQMDRSAGSLLTVTENNLNELHKINHDIQNQYAYMRMLLRNQSYEALDKYFEELTGTFSEPLVPFVDCGNRVLDLIFNMENAKAQELGVAFDVKAAPPHTLPFRDVDLCNLYANLIDNALEACAAEKLPNAAVHVTVNVRGDYLFTQISNPTVKDKSFLEKGGGTTKSDHILHGRGRGIVRDIVKRYNGRVAARIENGVYYAEFMLDLTYQQEEAHE